MLRERDYIEAYVLPNTMKAALAPSLARIPLRVGYLGESRVGLLNRIHKAKAAREPMTLHYARLAEEPGVEPALPLPSPALLSDMEKAKATAARFGIAGPFTVLCPGAEFGPAKRWPYFGELAARLDGQVVVPSTAKERKGIQPVVTLKANGGERAEVKIGKQVTFSARVEVPTNTGSIVAVEWDFEGAGTFPVNAELTTSNKKASTITLKSSHSFARPGTYFATVKVTTQRQGNDKTPFARIPNLSRVRVVVK